MGWGRGDRLGPALRLCSRLGGAVTVVTVAAALSGCALRAGHRADAREAQQLLAAPRCACNSCILPLNRWVNEALGKLGRWGRLESDQVGTGTRQFCRGRSCQFCHWHNHRAVFPRGAGKKGPRGGASTEQQRQLGWRGDGKAKDQRPKGCTKIWVIRRGEGSGTQCSGQGPAKGGSGKRRWPPKQPDCRAVHKPR